MKKFIYKHNLGTEITKFMEENVLPHLEADEQNDSYDLNASEGLVDLTDTVDTSGFEKEIEGFLEAYGYDKDNAHDAEYIESNECFKLCSTISWDEEVVTLSYVRLFYYLIDEDHQYELTIPNNYQFYLENALNGNDSLERVS